MSSLWLGLPCASCCQRLCSSKPPSSSQPLSLSPNWYADSELALPEHPLTTTTTTPYALQDTRVASAAGETQARLAAASALGAQLLRAGLLGSAAAQAQAAGAVLDGTAGTADADGDSGEGAAGARELHRHLNRVLVSLAFNDPWAATRSSLVDLLRQRSVSTSCTQSQRCTLTPVSPLAPLSRRSCVPSTLTTLATPSHPAAWPVCDVTSQQPSRDWRSPALTALWLPRRWASPAAAPSQTGRPPLTNHPRQRSR